MKIALAADHAGFRLKEFLKGHLGSAGHTVEDFGTRSEEAVDFTDFAYPAAMAVSTGQAQRAVIVDGAGYPSAIVANLLPNCFAAVANDPVSATFARTHSDTNILCIGGKIVGEALAAAIVDAWMNQQFLGGKYATRVDKVRAMAARHRVPSDSPRPLAALTLQDLRDALQKRQPIIINDQTIITPSVRDLLG